MTKSLPLSEIPVIHPHTDQSPEDIDFNPGVILPFDKPLEWTSFDVVKYVRNRIPVRKVGHAGTLDPLASGLLVLCCGKATKSISQIQDHPKTYLAEITFGAATASFDSATDITDTGPVEHLDRQKITALLEEQFLGEIEQVPPVYSALQKDGQRYYKLARKGVDVSPEPRFVKTYELNIVTFELPVLTLEIKSGKGFYVRSLAHDLGKSLGTFAHLSRLKRTGIGEFSVRDAWKIDQFNTWCKNG